MRMHAPSLLLFGLATAFAANPCRAAAAAQVDPRLIRDDQALTVAGVREVWRLQWAAPPVPACEAVSPMWYTCPCSGFSFGEAGVLDLVSAAREHLGTDAAQGLLGHEPGPADARWDPYQQVPLRVPVHCVHGTDDDIVPISQSESYVAAAKQAGAQASLTRVAGDHFVLIDPDSDAWRRTLAILDDLG